MLVDDLARYENFLFLLGACSCPVRGAGGDWYVLARRRYDVEAMYRADGPYRGVRWPAVLVWLLGVPGLNWDQPGTVTAWVSLVEGLFDGLLGLPFPLSARLPWLGASIPAFAVAFLAMLAVGRRPREEARMTPAFAGMPDEGLAFLEDLEERNTKEFFDANKAVFKEQVQAPFAALVEAAAARLRRSVPDIGQPKVFRIYRDLRFSKDKTPYKTSMSASVPSRTA